MKPLQISPFSKLAYGLGSIAFGIKNNGFDYFFLIFYSQVMGVDAYLVGVALLIAMIAFYMEFTISLLMNSIGSLLMNFAVGIINGFHCKNAEGLSTR